MSSLVIHTASWLVSPPAPPIPDAAIAVLDGAIVSAGARRDVMASHAGAQVVDHPGCALLPGFVNAHTHLELTHYPAWRLRSNVDYHPRRFVDWMIQLIKVKRGVAAEEMPSSIAEGIRMCLESGTTAVGEIVTEPSHAPLYHSSALSGRLFFEVLGNDPLRFENLLKRALDACATTPQNLLTAGLSPHSTYTLAGEHLPRIAQEVAMRSLPLAIHLSESADETDFIFDTRGPLAEVLYPFVDWQRYLTPPRRCSSTDLLDRAGLLTQATLAIHCVHLTLSDAETLKRRGVSVVLCPRSNERLDVGRAPVSLFTKLGIPLALGTDSLASNDSLSLWDEMRYALEAFPTVLAPADVLQMVTTGGAQALGLAGTHGALLPGRRADFQVVGHAGDQAGKVLEQIVYQGVTEDVYLAGEHYPARPGHSPFHRRSDD